MTHKSFNQFINNEKFEFLGDRVLGLALSKKLFKLYPKENEGVLDKRFAQLVNRKTCCSVAWSINLQDFILIADTKKKITLNDEKILSDACEALIGAIYLDQGFAASEKFILKNWNSFIKRSNIIEIDSKSKLQEHSLKKYKKLPLYTTFKQTGPRHNPTFKIQVQIPKSKKYIGYGKSKKIAQQDAASQMIKNLNIN